MMLRQWVDGRENGVLPLDDRGLNYGDGVFRSMLVSAGRVDDLPGQCAHLANDFRKLCGREVDPTALARTTQSVIDPDIDAVLRVCLTTGSSERGYARPAVIQPRQVMRLTQLPEWPHQLWTRGVTVTSATMHENPQSHWSGLKHLNRLAQVALAEQLPAEADEQLVFAGDGRLCGGGKSNVLWLDTQGQWHTPSASRTPVCGRMQARLIEALATLGHSVQSSDPDCASLQASARSILLCNALIGMWPVRDWDGDALALPAEFFRLRAALRHPLVERAWEAAS